MFPSTDDRYRSSAIDCGRLVRHVRSFSALAFMVGFPGSQSVLFADDLIDAVPKKRGPKTDVLEALLKRVDGLEKRLKDEQKSNSSSTEGGSTDKESPSSDVKPERPQLLTASIPNETAVYSPISPRYEMLLVLP